MDAEQHKELSEVLNNVSGRAAISNYECDLWYQQPIYLSEIRLVR